MLNFHKHYRHCLVAIVYYLFVSLAHDVQTKLTDYRYYLETETTIEKWTCFYTLLFTKIISLNDNIKFSLNLVNSQ